MDQAGGALRVGKGEHRALLRLLLLVAGCPEHPDSVWGRWRPWLGAAQSFLLACLVLGFI